MESVATEQREYVFDGRLPWLEKRKKYIGSSDAPAILGHGYAGESISTVWADKIGQPIKEFSKADIELMEIGRIGEKFVVEMFAKKNSEIKVERKASEFAIEICQKYPFCCASLDASGIRDGKRFPIEAKVISNQPQEWENDQCPIKYQIQLQHQMMVIDAEFGVVAAYVCGRYVERWFERDDAFLATAVEVYKMFWKHVIDRTPPPDDSPQAFEVRRGAVQWGVAKRLGRVGSQEVREYLTAQQELKKAEQRVATAKIAIADKAKGVEFIILDDTRVYKITRSGLKEFENLPRGVKVTI